MTKRLLLIAALSLLSMPAWAQQKVEITADVFTVEESASEAVFTGNVVVIHPSVKVWADKVVAIYGAAGPSDIESFVATGKVVKLVTPEQTATGERAVFTPGDQLLRLTGNVLVVNSGGTVGSQELVVNLETNVSTFTSSGGGRVTGIFNSQ
ncbi:LptA/OstA family protein [Devosia sp. 2618]|uniref:LptA/OstA family protein n=1 Tax=Devosia sp. 2618 TaxID=3156454 RepID=UPI0033944884